MEKRLPVRAMDSIKATIVRRYLTLVAIKLCKRWRTCHGGVLFLSPKICVKYGYFQDVSEAATMQFIARNTSIPVPKVHCASRHKDITYIVMERIDGEYIGRRWYYRSNESKARILQQFKAMVNEMRNITPPPNMGVASVLGGSLYDGRLPAALERNSFGPFDTVTDFHNYLRRGINAHPNHLPEVTQLIEMHQGDWPICFTHADLSSLNILTRGDQMVGIVDWETAGWYPSYREYTSAWNVNPQNMFWRQEVDKFLVVAPNDLIMDQLRVKYFGEFGL